ncbi:MAG TPA: hypothetical protein VH092_35790 [Urbifossiella sp.]|jgi:hypothetical protein|nr:hypothetical protein [Urbifossiella sp.]
MRGAGRRILIGLLAAVVFSAGGGCATKPFARDPLLRDGRGVKGDREAAARRPEPPAEPIGPDPPPGPTIGGSFASGATSR